jgi:two-component system phosphate regulon sensor histidine kinase PhoR
MFPWLIAILAMLTVGALWLSLRRARRELRVCSDRLAHLERTHDRDFDQAHALLHAIMKSVEDGLLILDGNLTIRHANPSAQRLLGSELVGKTLLEAIRQPDAETLVSDAHKVRNEVVERRIEFEEHRILHARALTLPDSDQAIITLRDVTQLQRLERARREMVSNITHELSAPITSIGLLADTLLTFAEREKPKRIRKMAKDIRRETDTLMQLVQEMRDLSLIESGQMPVRLTPCAVRPIVTRTLEQLESLAENKEQTIEVNVPDDLIILADEVQIQRALKNIVHNAIKFTQQGGHIRISVERYSAEAVIAVADNGPGIPAEDLPRVFERFFQVDPVRRDGTGLGLAIVRHIVRAHGGRTWAESVEGEGATFYIALPLADAAISDTDESPD